MLIVGIVSILSLGAGPSGSLAFSGRRLLGQSSDELLGQFKLLHWSNPEAPHFVPGVSFSEKFKLAIESSKARVAALSNRMNGEAPNYGPAPAPTSYVSPIFNLIFEYGMEITIGTPPHTYAAIADTGSDLVWIQCAACDYCEPQADPFYDPTNSSSYKPMLCNDPLCLPPQDSCSKNNTCQYDYIYGSGETIGDMALETITLMTTTGKTQTSENFGFGCDLETYLELGGVDGLVGLGQGPQSFTSQLGSLFDDKFSYCLVSIYDSNTTASLLLFGEAAVPKAPIQYTPMVQNPNPDFYGTETFYYIGLTGIKLNGEAVDIPPGTFDIAPDGIGGVISDSGTTLTYLASDAYAPLLDMASSLIPYPVSSYSADIGLDLCYDLSNVSYPEFPTFTVVFEGFELDLPLDNVFIGGPLFEDYIGTDSIYCMTFADSYSSFSIYGNVVQQNYQVLHDRKAQQFGFAQVQCDELTL